MRILGVPTREMAAHSLATLLFASLVFLPAIAGFGAVALAGEGMAIPLELPLAGLPGSITFTQLASYLLGGIFSFALAYAFCRSFLPSMAASFTYNFSILHFQGAMLDLGHSMAFALVPLLFLAYFTREDKKGRDLALLIGALALIALGDIALGFLCGCVILLDIFRREHSLNGHGIRSASIASFALITFIASGLSFPGADAPGLEAVFVPSTLMLMSLVTGAYSDAGVYIGFGAIALLASSILIKGAEDDERYFRNGFAISLLAYFPLALAGLGLAAGAVLMALIFLIPLTAIFFERIFRGESFGVLVLALITIGTVIERWPLVEGFVLKLAA